jgi:SagB-type dehydrogenase family enzyme
MPDAHRPDATRRAVLAGSLAAAGGLTFLPAAVAAPPAQAALASPDRDGAVTLEQALARRRSERSFAAQPLALAAVSQLLWAAQGITAAGGRRTAPSAGALYPLELHLVATRVDALLPGVHRYLPAGHALQLVAAQSAAPALMRAAMGQGAVGAAAAVVVITAIEGRTARRYGARTGRYVAFEAGAAAQNLALQAAALGLGTVVVGAFDDAAVARALQLPAGEQPVVLMPIGTPA